MSAIYVLKNPRWEDFEWTRKKENEVNMWAWLGNGIVKAQRDGTTTSHYLRNIDRPPVPEKSKATLAVRERAGVVALPDRGKIPVVSVDDKPQVQHIELDEGKFLNGLDGGVDPVDGKEKVVNFGTAVVA